MNNYREPAPDFSKKLQNSLSAILIDSDDDKENDIIFSPERVQQNIDKHK